MKRLLKWFGMLVASCAFALGVLMVVAWEHSESALARVYVVDDAPLQVPSDPAALAHGQHLWITRGCAECHGEAGEGRLLFDGGPVIRVVPSNITPAALAGRYDADALAAAIRHGVRPDGTPLVFMPSGDFAELSDTDVAALVAWMQTLPDSDNDPGPTQVRPLARVLHLFGRFPLLPAERIDHSPRQRSAPPPAVDPRYGRYVAQLCTGCHGVDFRGGLVMAPGAPPSANLTPHATGLASWSEADFLRALREGVRPDGRKLDPLMPIAATARMTDVELSAMWAFLTSLEPLPMTD